MSSLSQAAVESFSFHDAILEVIREGADLWVSVRRVADAIGLQAHGQVAKLREKVWAKLKTIRAAGSDGKQYEQVFIHLDSLPMWLATIETSRVAAEARPTIERFQLECAQVLRDHFFGAPAAPKPFCLYDAKGAREHGRDRLAEAAEAFTLAAVWDANLDHTETESMAIARGLTWLLAVLDRSPRRCEWAFLETWEIGRRAVLWPEIHWERAKTMDEERVVETTRSWPKAEAPSSLAVVATDSCLSPR